LRKGASVRELVHSDRRLRYPMKLVNGQWTRVSWDTAINEIGDKTARSSREVGRRLRLLARSAKMTNEGAYLFRKFWRLLGNQQHRPSGAHLPFNDRDRRKPNTWGYGAMTNSFNDIRNAKTQIIMGGNPAEAHPVSCSICSKARSFKGPTCVVIDPRLREPRAHATEYVRMRPGTDIPVLYGMMWTSSRTAGRTRSSFKQPSTVSTTSARKWRSGIQKEVERVSGVPGEQLSGRSPKMFATEKPVNADLGMGQTQKNRRHLPTCGELHALLMTGMSAISGAGANIFVAMTTCRRDRRRVDIVTTCRSIPASRRRLKTLGAGLGSRL